MDKVIWKGSLIDSEEKEVEEYASSTWSDAARNVEMLRRIVWKEAYQKRNTVEKIARVASLKDDHDDFE